MGAVQFSPRPDWDGLRRSMFDFGHSSCWNGSPYAPFSGMTGPGQLPSDLSGEDWELLLNQAVGFATQQAARLRWRGALGGVLPDGYDPNSIASEAILELLKGWAPHPEFQSGSQPLALPSSLPDVRRQLQRLVLRQLNRFHHRKENRLLRNEPDLSPFLTDDGELVPIVEALSASDPDPAQILLLTETTAEMDNSIAAFSAFLGTERRLKRLFHCLCAGIRQPKALASKLKLSRQAITSLQKRLQRRFARFLQAPQPANYARAPEKLSKYPLDCQ